MTNRINGTRTLDNALALLMSQSAMFKVQRGLTGQYECWIEGTYTQRGETMLEAINKSIDKLLAKNEAPK